VGLQLLQFFLNTTDDFLCSSVKNIFEKTERNYKAINSHLDLSKELQSFQNKPLGCVIGIESKFETAVKLKIKLIIGIFFVLIPLLGFGALAFISDIQITYAFIMTFVVAILVSSRMDEIAKRYVLTRQIA
jgi:ABC-type multidrug transport system fused ATPase/permease subunit